MSNHSKLDQLKMLLDIDGSSEDARLSVYLRLAEQKVLNRVYPFGTDKSTVPAKYSFKVVEIAQYLYLRRGSEGETSHSENGVSRSYESADIPDSMLSEVVPMVGGVG